jgi:hypothetical protein
MLSRSTKTDASNKEQDIVEDYTEKDEKKTPI